MREKTNGAARLHDLRGLLFRIYSSRCVKASRLSLVTPQKEELVSLKILYAGPVSGPYAKKDPERIRMENEEYIYSSLFSPFPEEPAEFFTDRLFRDKNNDLWAGYYSAFFLRSPGLYSEGLKIVFEITGILAVKKPEIEIQCNGKSVFKETFSQPGVYERVIDLSGAGDDLIRYISETRRLQFKIMDEFERLCEKYGIMYYLICGGLIGCVRDGGLIPWDDDLDIALTREGYEKLSEAVKEEWKDEEFLWLEPSGYGKGVFLDFMTRIVYMAVEAPGDVFERLGSRGRQDIHYKQTMDVYILDDAPESKTARKFLNLKLLYIYALALGHRDDSDPMENTDNGKIKTRIASFIIKAGKRMPLEKILKRYEKTAGGSSGDTAGKSRLCYFSNGYYRNFGTVFEKAWFGEGKKTEADSRTWTIPAEPEKYLERMYGEYNALPYPWKRNPVHYNGPDDGWK